MVTCCATKSVHCNIAWESRASINYTVVFNKQCRSSSRWNLTIDEYELCWYENMFYRTERPRARHYKEVRQPISNVVFISNMIIKTHVGVMIILMIRVSLAPHEGTVLSSMGEESWIFLSVYFQSAFVSNAVLYSNGKCVLCCFDYVLLFYYSIKSCFSLFCVFCLCSNPQSATSLNCTEVIGKGTFDTEWFDTEHCRYIQKS